MWTRIPVWIVYLSGFSSASGIALGTVWLSPLVAWQWRRRLHGLVQLPLFWPVVVLSVAIILSAAFADGSGFAKPVGKIKYLFFYFVLVLYFTADPGIKRRLAQVGAVLAAVLAVVGVLQFLRIFCPVYALGLLADPPVIVQGMGGRFAHARGLLYHHNPYAYTSLCLFYWLFAHALGPFSRKQKWVYFGGATMALVCIAVSGSRGSWVAFAFSLLVLAGLLGRRYWKVFGAVIGVGALIAAGVSVGFSDRLKSIRPGENSERLALWRISTQMFADHPVLGTGYHRGFENHQKKYMTAEELANPHFPTDPHSVYFDLAATTGVVGLGAFLFFIYSVFRHYVLILRRARAEDFVSALAGLGAFSVFVIAAAFDSHFYHTQTLMVTLFFLALGVSTHALRERIGTP